MSLHRLTAVNRNMCYQMTVLFYFAELPVLFHDELQAELVNDFAVQCCINFLSQSQL